MNKQDTINSLQEDKTYSYKHVKQLLEHLTGVIEVPSKLKRGDVFSQHCGVKKRPVVIVKVLKDIVIGIPLTTNEDELAMTPHNSRFFRGGWFTNQLITARIEYVEDNFLGVLDDNKSLNEAVKQIKQFYNGVL